MKSTVSDDRNAVKTAASDDSKPTETSRAKRDLLVSNDSKPTEKTIKSNDIKSTEKARLARRRFLTSPNL